MNCPTCASSVVAGAAFCDNCGTAISQSPTVPTAASVAASNQCANCHASFMPGEAFCGACGAQLPQATSVASVPQPQPHPTPVASSLCANCSSSFMPGSTFCDNCGSPVAMGQTISSQANVATQQQYQNSTTNPQPQPILTPMVTARFTVQASNTTLQLPSGKNTYIIGREDPVSNHFPDIDLNVHGGDEGGVSRHHATLYVQDSQFLLEDNRSVNGTTVNKTRIQPTTRQPLQHGDEVRFGQVVLIFQTS